MRTNRMRECSSRDAKRRAVGFGALLLVLGIIVVGTSMAFAYTPKVTYDDLKKAKASCIGSMCTINGTTWDCKGVVYCTRVTT